MLPIGLPPTQGSPIFIYNPPKEFAGMKVEKVYDYLTSEATSLVDGSVEKLTLPKSNVLSYALPGGNGAVIRPSGTEPKIKLYCLLCGKTREDAESIAEKFKTDISKTIK